MQSKKLGSFVGTIRPNAEKLNISSRIDKTHTTRNEFPRGTTVFTRPVMELPHRGNGAGRDTRNTAADHRGAIPHAWRGKLWRFNPNSN